MSLNKIVEFLNANPVQYLATVGRDGKAKCRPFMFAGELDGKLWFCTNNQKDVYKDLQAKQHGCQGDEHLQPHREGPVRRSHQPHR